MTEQTAIQELQQGNVDALDELISIHQKRVFNTILNIVQNIEDAEELTQDVFVKLAKNSSSFKGNAAFSTWLYRIAVNEALAHLRKRKAKKNWAWFTSIFQKEEKLAESHVDFLHPGVATENKEQMLQIFAAIKTLPEKQQVAFTLRHVEKMSQQEIAAILQCSQGAVESLINRAKQALQKQLTNKK